MVSVHGGEFACAASHVNFQIQLTDPIHIAFYVIRRERVLFPRNIPVSLSVSRGSGKPG